MLTQLMTAVALQGDNELREGGRYLFSFQNDPKGYIRIITTGDLERYYADIHHFFNHWSQVNSLGVAKDKKAFLELLEIVKNGGVTKDPPPVSED